MYPKENENGGKRRWGGPWQPLVEVKKGTAQQGGRNKVKASASHVGRLGSGAVRVF